MFSSFNLSDWVSSAGAALLLFTMMTVWGLIVGAIVTAIWGEEREVSAGRMRKAEPGSRKAA